LDGCSITLITRVGIGIKRQGSFACGAKVTHIGGVGEKSYIFNEWFAIFINESDRFKHGCIVVCFIFIIAMWNFDIFVDPIVQE
jgi:hypothetical protein